MFFWRAVDDEGEVIDVLVQRRRDTKAALKLLRRLLQQPVEPQTITADGLAPYGEALDRFDFWALSSTGLALGKPSDKEHPSGDPTRGTPAVFKSQASAQRFLITHAAAYKTLDIERHLTSRRTLPLFQARAASARTVAFS